ncbi:MAG: FkbM family methyltransferase [Hyphomonadaceae bacterium]
MDVYPVIRDMQSRFSGLLEAKASLQRTVRRIMKKPFEEDFNILERLDLGDRLCLDIGGNRGQSIDAIRLMKPDCKIISIEPSGALADALRRNTQEDLNTEILNIGLGDEQGSFDLYTPFYRNFMYDGLASFSEEEASQWLNADTVWRFDPDLLRLQKDTCKIELLDSLALDPVFIKIDVQGYERQVLIGGHETIERNKPLILMENNKPGDKHLVDMGWKRLAYNGGDVQLDELGYNNTLYLHPDSDAYAALIG